MKNLLQTNSLQLSDEEFETIEGLSGLHYTPTQMAIYLDQDVTQFLIALREPNSKIQFHIVAGKLKADYNINEQQLKNAQSGNITAAMLVDKARDRNDLEQIKKRILYNED